VGASAIEANRDVMCVYREDTRVAHDRCFTPPRVATLVSSMLARTRLCVSYASAILVAAALTTLVGCDTYRDELARSEQAFEQSSYERSLAILRVLEPDLAHLNDSERTRYAYLRGMTDYRIGYKADARHWLALASSMETATPGSIPEDWKSRLNDAMKELNTAVYENGVEALNNTKISVEERPKVAKPKTEDEP
jgi:hypothetical protein